MDSHIGSPLSGSEDAIYDGGVPSTSCVYDDAVEKQISRNHSNEHGYKAKLQGTNDLSSSNSSRRCCAFRKHIMYHLGGDHVFLLLLGVSMALISFFMDYTIHMCQEAHFFLYKELHDYTILQFLTWVSFPLVFIIFSVGFVNIVAPQAIGSGIPEMKTILRGVKLDEYLTVRVLIAKMVGLVASLGSRLPIGKEGPFVHIASIVATLLNKLLMKCKARPQRDGYRNEMLAAACAVGVACNFAAPIGGVLFSIEVTTTYFAVRDYWRGFFGAVCGAFMFRLLAVWRNEEETITALFKTNFRLEFPYDLQELIGFTMIGIVCGLAGALFVYLHKKVSEIHEIIPCLKKCFQPSIFIYPALVSIIISSLKFPGGLGQYMAGELTLTEAVDALFDNKTWNTLGYVDESEVLPDMQDGWKHPNVNVYITLSTFIVMHFVMTAFAITLPIPAGVFMPVFVTGAAFGRLIGETMSALYPEGFYSISSGQVYHVMPGGYAVIGAASLSGAVTHTVSTAVIVFELTGQISHILPVMIAVLIANMIAQGLQPSIYDGIIQIKKLPYLPDMPHGRRKLDNLILKDFMVRNFYFLRLNTTRKRIEHILHSSPALSFPVVKDSNMALLGSISRTVLLSASAYTGNNSNGIDRVYTIRRQEKTSESQGEPDTSPKSVSVAQHSAGADLQNVISSKQIHSSADWIVQFDETRLEPAPFQLVENTSLSTVYSLLSLLGITEAYVTNSGALVGLITIEELREVMENIMKKGQNSGRTIKRIPDCRWYGLESQTVEFMPLKNESSSSDED